MWTSGPTFSTISKTLTPGLRVGFPTAPQARRPFQGWRYLEPKDAPPDLSTMDAGDLPPELAKQLREMGAW